MLALIENPDRADDFTEFIFNAPLRPGKFELKQITWRKLVKTNKSLADPVAFSGRNRGRIAIRNSANGAVRAFEQKM